MLSQIHEIHIPYHQTTERVFKEGCLKNGDPRLEMTKKIILKSLNTSTALSGRSKHLKKSKTYHECKKIIYAKNYLPKVKEASNVQVCRKFNSKLTNRQFISRPIDGGFFYL